MKDFEPVGDGLEILFGSFCFQVGQTGTLRLPERVLLPSIRPASWTPHPVLRTISSTDDSYDSISCNSDLCDPPSDEGTYGSGSESCGSSGPIYERYQCAIVIQADVDQQAPNPPPNPTPNPPDRNGGNRRSQSPPPEGENNGHIIRLSKEGWAQARNIVAGNVVLHADSSRDLLMAYHLLLIEEHKKQVKMQEVLDRHKQAASESSARRAALSAMGIGSSSNANQGNKHRSRVANMDPNERREGTRTLHTSFMEMDADDNVIPKTPQAAIMAATAYLAAYLPPEGDPKRAMHKSALTGLGLDGAALHQEAPTEPKKKAPVRFDRSPTPSSEEEEHDLPRWKKSSRHHRDYDARDALTQRKIDKARAKCACSSESEMDEDEGELCGARCFCRSVRRTRMPRNFKIPLDTPKFDGTQDPKAWLSDHLSSVKLHGGNKETAMQCLQLQLTGADRIWLSSLSSGSIRSWDEIAYGFIRNFKGTSKRPASIEELRACTQRTGESIRSYILRWSNTKNSASHISEERAIDAFRDGVKRQDFKEEF